MSLLWYGVQGEGRGHAARSRVLIERLRAEGHAVRIFTGGDAEAMFAGDPDLERVPLMRFAYLRGRLSLARSILRNAGIASQLLTMTGPTIGSLSRRSRRERPDLVVTDFEPFLCRVGKRARVPVVCVDHQHCLSDTVLPRLGRIGDDVSGRILSFGVPRVSHSPHRVVSSFAHFPRRAGSDALLVGCFLRPRVVTLAREAVAPRSGRVTVYVKESALLERILPVLRTRKETFEVWSDLSGREEIGNVALRPLHPTAFLESLAASEWLLSTAGNQGLGEALALGRPVLAIPVPGQTEQEYNGLALERSGCGRKLSLSDLAGDALEAFARERPRHLQALRDRRALSPELVDGTDAALEYLTGIIEAGFTRGTRQPTHATGTALSGR